MEKLKLHLRNSPFHEFSSEDAELEARSANIDEWDDEDTSIDEPEVWQRPKQTPEPANDDHARLAGKGAQMKGEGKGVGYGASRSFGKGSSSNHGPYMEAYPKGSSDIARVPLQNEQVADFMHQQLQSAFRMVKVTRPSKTAHV